jgi:ABC transporter related
MINNIMNFIGSILFSFKTLKKVSFMYSFIKNISNILLPIIAIFMTYLVKDIVDKLASKDIGDLVSITVCVLIYCTLKIIIGFLNGCIEYSTEMESNKLRKNMGEDIIKKSLELDIEWYDNATLYDELQYVQYNYNSIANLTNGIIEIFSSIISLAVICIIALDKLWIYTIIMIISCIPSGIAKFSFTKKIYKFNIDRLSEERKVDYIVSLVTDKNYAQDFRQYPTKSLLLSKYRIICELMFGERRKILFKKLIVSSISLLLPEIVLLGIILSVIFKISRNEMTVGDFSLYVGLMSQLCGNMSRVVYSIDGIIEDSNKVSFYKQFINKKNNVNDGFRHIKDINTIELKKISFKYPFTENYIFKNLSLHINSGDKIAIVGENGAGKSTMIKLLLRFYDVDEGEIVINGFNIKEYVVGELRSCIGIYFQNNNNYAFKIIENITLRESTDINLSNVVEALKLSGLNKVIKNKKISLSSYNTKLFNKDGVELSGGENQKLSLARTIYMNKKLLIFDEPSAFLDAKSEYEFFKGIRNKYKDRTLIYISHRLTNIVKSDRIVVIKNGEVIEEGFFDELMNNKGVFYEYYGLYK